jgi:hypothetical protein
LLTSSVVDCGFDSVVDCGFDQRCNGRLAYIQCGRLWV